MKKLFMAVIALMMTISASAQFYIYFSDGTVAKVDSISMIAPGEPEKPDTPTEPEEPENTENGHEYVDLGLSVKWATCNVGATKPEEYGDYFAWGEVEPKEEEYHWSTYKWCNGSYDTQTKYCTDGSYGTVDNKNILEAADDAATANWSGSWRMPTTEELQELINNCTWTWTQINSVNGYNVTSNKNGNSIFLPAAGCRRRGGLDNAGSSGAYWLSSLGTDRSDNACNLDFGSNYVSWRNDGGRDYGRSIRPVCQ